MDTPSVKGMAVVTCAALRPEMERLVEEGVLEDCQFFHVSPGSHERPHQLEEELPVRMREAGDTGLPVMVALGTKCYFDLDRPERTIDRLIEDIGVPAVRTRAEDCIDLLADKREREALASGRSVYWLTPGWVLERDRVFEGWDAGKANETFPRHDAAMILDGIGFFDWLSMEDPERILDMSDWMGVGLEPAAVSLERMADLMARAARESKGEGG